MAHLMFTAILIAVTALLSHMGGACPMSQHAEWVVVTESSSLLLDNLDETAIKNYFLLPAAHSKSRNNFTMIPLDQVRRDNQEILHVPIEKGPCDHNDKRKDKNKASIWQVVRRLCLLVVRWTQDIIFAFLSTMARYEDVLVLNPAVTKSITAAVVSFVGDLLAQAVENTRKTHATKGYNFCRSLSLAAEGLFISGPLLHFAYDWFESFVTSWKIGNVWIESVAQVFMDILVLDSFFTWTLMVTSAVLQGHDVVKELKNDYIPAVYVAWMSSFSMAPLQMLNFGVVPLRYRVLVTNLQDVIWNAAVSTMAHRSRQ